MGNGLVILDSKGKPVTSETPPGESGAAMDFLQRAGMRRTPDGGLVVPPEALERIRSERLRSMTTTAVPSTPRHMMRDGAGVGVRKGHGRTSTMSMEGLRRIREVSPLIQVIHRARNYQMRQMAQKWSGRRGDVGWRICHKDHLAPNAVPPEGFDRVINGFERMWMVPHTRLCPTTGSLLAQLEEDYLTINRPTVEILHSVLDPNKIAGWRPVDGAIVWPTLLFLEQWQSSDPSWSGGYKAEDLTMNDQLELASKAFGWDLVGADHCLVREGVLEAVYPANKLIVAPLVNRTDINVAGYPPSHVEEALELILAHKNTFDYNANYFTRGMMAEFILGISGDVHDDSIQAFVDMFRESTQGVSNAWQPPIMPLPLDGVLSKIDLRASNRDMMMELWMSVLISMTAAIYRIDVSALNMKPWDTGSGSLSEPSRAGEIALAKEEGLQGDLSHLTESIFNQIAARVHPDLRVVWEYGGVDVSKEATTNESRAKVDTTRNELRLERGERPMGFWVPPDEYDALTPEKQKKFDANLWNMPSDPSFVSAMQMQQQAEEQQPQDTDGFGGGADQPDGFGGKQEFPFGRKPGAEGGAQEPEGGAQQPGPGQQPPEGQGGPPAPEQAMEKAATRGATARKVTVYVEEF